MRLNPFGDTNEEMLVRSCGTVAEPQAGRDFDDDHFQEDAGIQQGPIVETCRPIMIRVGINLILLGFADHGLPKTCIGELRTLFLDNLDLVSSTTVKGDSDEALLFKSKVDKVLEKYGSSLAIIKEQTNRINEQDELDDLAEMTRSKLRQTN